ncbi:Protein of unknown function [Gryllus bimaculatus]|nr:Protein of unknown function [Gryllus bimaculatus]
MQEAQEAGGNFDDEDPTTKAWLDCLRESGIDPVQLQKMEKQQIPDDTRETRKLMCCVMKRKGVFNERGEVKADVCEIIITDLKNRMESLGRKAEGLKSCCKPDGADCGKKALNMLKCFIDEAQE